MTQVYKKPYLLIIALTFILIISLLISSLLASEIIKAPSNTFNKVRVLTNPVINKVEKHYTYIENEGYFKGLLQDELLEINGRLKIIGLDGKIIFDSLNEEYLYKDTYVDIKTEIHYDKSFNTQYPGYVRFSAPIVVKGVHAANAVFVLPSDLLADKEKNIFSALIPLIMGGMLILAVIFLYSYGIKKNIVLPIESLVVSAKEISHGNLNGKIQNTSSDEMNSFLNAFDLMRLELKDNLIRQADYEKARKELISKISHELRTPVASIKAYTEGLKDGIAKNPETVSKYVDVIMRKTDSLSALIDDLMSHALMDLGKLRINKQECYSRKMIEEILKPLTIQFAKDTVKFSVNGDIPNVLINADPLRIEQVIVNLIHNARKYTNDGGSITFNTSIDNGFLKISIEDTGKGVPEDEIPFIFEEFYRAGNVSDNDFEGFGLGLSICKYIVEEHGGTIFVKSLINTGSIFSFTIPKV